MDERRLMAYIARLYYDKGLNQGAIGHKLSLSRQKVQRLLTKARAEGIVHILIRSPADSHTRLEELMESRFGLRKALIVETANDEDQALVTGEVAAVAADYLRGIMQPKQRIAISWGGTLREIVEACYHSPPPNAAGIEVIQALGGLGDPNNEVHATELTRRLAAYVNGRGVILSAPGLAGSREVYEAFMKDSHVSQVLEKARRADIFLLSIGAPRKDSVLISEGSILTWKDLQDILKIGGVGDLNLRYIDYEGKPVISALNDRVIGLGLEDMKTIGTVIGVAGGRVKLRAVRGALYGGYLDVLITDHLTAEKIMEECGDTEEPRG